MPTYPILDRVGAPVLLGLFLLLLIAERRWSLRRRVDRWIRRASVNLAVAGPSFLVLRLLLIPAVVAVATWTEEHDFGLVRMLPLPALLAAIVALLFLDYSMFLWHWLNHRVPFLWRFHHVHHSDLDLDVTTAFRFHFGEMLLSSPSFFVGLGGSAPIASTQRALPAGHHWYRKK